jgi:hypothetical protein
MTYIRGAAGLLVETVSGQTIAFASDGSWRTVHYDGFNAAATRISVQLEYDAPAGCEVEVSRP